MNKNIPHAVKVVRKAIGSTGSDPAAAVVRALDAAGLLVDPEKTYGAEGAREHQEESERTELEAQALAWDASCQHAARVAAGLRRQLGEHPAFQNVQVDRDQVLVSLHIVDRVHQWAEWRRFFGIRHDKEVPLPYVVAGDGYRDGVRVSVVAYDLPQAREHARRIAKAPYEVEGIVYDLALPQRDADGDVWFYQGVRTADGMPLLSLDGRPERCTLANIARLTGPLTPVTDDPSSQATPVMTGGEQA